MNTTGNYQLNQWEGSDRIMRTDFNADNAKIDAALKANANSISSLTGQLGAKGNCRIYTTSYVGSGNYGEETPTSVTLSFQPKLLHIMGKTSGVGVLAAYGCEVGFALGNFANWMRFTWNGNRVSWYSNSVDTQMNTAGESYVVTALV